MVSTTIPDRPRLDFFFFLRTLQHICLKSWKNRVNRSSLFFVRLASCLHTSRERERQRGRGRKGKREKGGDGKRGKTEGEREKESQ